ncbi:MAG: hypothetical protein DRP89_03645 [Candidatus Neomarinimicrobiota bacterium]|nr:MAG: hypothetical protein DRP89_03645 [Candidatus Neomarinimicrobiota bacterium]
MNVILWIAFGFLLGGIPFSYLLGHLFLHTDIRQYGDGNPGAANVWKAGSWRTGFPACILDYLKALIPVGLAYLKYDIKNWELIPIALAPVIGHAFSPFLHFRGGKAVAVTLGIWSVLLPGEGILGLGLSMFIFFILQNVDSWTVILGMLFFFTYLLFKQVSIVILLIWLGNIIILTYKHRQDLKQPVILKSWVLKLLRINN